MAWLSRAVGGTGGEGFEAAMGVLADPGGRIGVLGGAWPGGFSASMTLVLGDGCRAVMRGGSGFLEAFRMKLASAVFASNANGIVDFADASPVQDAWRYRHGGKNVLPLGCVTVTEVEAPEGYNVDSTVYVATIVRDGDTAKIVPGANWNV